MLSRTWSMGKKKPAHARFWAWWVRLWWVNEFITPMANTNKTPRSYELYRFRVFFCWRLIWFCCIGVPTPPFDDRCHNQHVWTFPSKDVDRLRGALVWSNLRAFPRKAEIVCRKRTSGNETIPNNNKTVNKPFATHTYTVVVVSRRHSTEDRHNVRLYLPGFRS